MDVFCKKNAILKISLGSQENNCAGVSFQAKFQVVPCNLIKKRLQHCGFSLNFAKFLRKT